MSLVNEALKKARLEAARQDAARRGLPLPGAPRAARHRVPPALLFRAGVAAAVVVLAALIFFAGRNFSPAPTAAPRTEAPESGPAVAARSASPEPAADPVEASAADRAVTPPAAQPAATPVEPGPAPAASARPSAATPADVAVPEETNDERSIRASQSRVRTAWEPAAERAAPEPSAAPDRSPRTREVEPERPAPAAETRPEPVQTAVRRLELPGSVRVELGGIAWSEERPFALINGRVVGPGDRVENLTVVAVEPRHVELRGQEGLYLLRLK